MTLIRRLTASFWRSCRCNIAGAKLQKFWYDRRRSDGDLTIIREKMSQFLLQDNISLTSEQLFWEVYIPLDSPFPALYYALYNSG